jgi:hypothetical protein
LNCGERLQIGGIDPYLAEDLSKQHGYHHRAHQRKGGEAGIAGRYLVPRLGARDDSCDRADDASDDVVVPPPS